MDVRLTPSSAVPIYQQIVDQIALQIAAGRLRIGDRLPSVRELARTLPANQNTVLKAYGALERDGFIERRHGDGTFVSQKGSPLRLAERRRRVSQAITPAVILARHFRLSPLELHRLLDEQLETFPSQSEG